MNKSKFTGQQIAFALQQAEGGTAVRYGGATPSEVKMLRHTVSVGVGFWIWTTPGKRSKNGGLSRQTFASGASQAELPDPKAGIGQVPALDTAIRAAIGKPTDFGSAHAHQGLSSISAPLLHRPVWGSIGMNYAAIGGRFFPSGVASEFVSYSPQ